MKNPFISIRDLCFSYGEDEEKVVALNHVNLDIYEGEFVAVLGHNGSGKSTLAKHLNGILLPTSGDVVAGGFNTRDEENIFKLRSQVGMVFQNPDNQIVATIVEDDVAFGPENLGVEPKEIRRRVDEALKRVGMYDFRLSEPHKLSGGQKQRVAIAGIIAMQPECIVLDEPTSMLDPRGRKEVMDTVKMLNEDYGITVIFITHYMDEAAKAKRVIVMEKGEIILDGNPREVFSHISLLKKVGLDVPESTYLARELKSEGIDIKGDILTVDELFREISRIKKV